MTLEDLIFLFKHPWGADTLNISATVDIIYKNEFRTFMSLIGGFYER